MISYIEVGLVIGQLEVRIRYGNDAVARAAAPGSGRARAASGWPLAGSGRLGRPGPPATRTESDGLGGPPTPAGPPARPRRPAKAARRAPAADAAAAAELE
jgi:hypothetical protein